MSNFNKINVCFYCNQDFVTKNKSQKFCGNLCRETYYEKPKKQKKPAIKPKSTQYRKAYFREFPDTDKNWHIHHIDGDRKNWSMDNLIAVPKTMHTIIHVLSRAKKRNLEREEIIFLLKEN